MRGPAVNSAARAVRGLQRALLRARLQNGAGEATDPEWAASREQGAGRGWAVCLGFAPQGMGTSRVVAGLGAGVFDAPLPIGAQKLEAQAVARWIDYAKEFRLKFDRRRRSNERSKTEYWTR